MAAADRPQPEGRGREETQASSHLTVKDERKMVELHFITTHLVQKRWPFGSQASINGCHSRTKLG